MIVIQIYDLKEIKYFSSDFIQFKNVLVISLVIYPKTDGSVYAGHYLWNWNIMLQWNLYFTTTLSFPYFGRMQHVILKHRCRHPQVIYFDRSKFFTLMTFLNKKHNY